MDTSIRIKFGIAFTLIILGVGLIALSPAEDTVGSDSEKINEKFTTFNSTEEFSSYIQQTTTRSGMSAFTTIQPSVSMGTTAGQDRVLSEATAETIDSQNIGGSDASSRASDTAVDSTIDTRQTNVQESSVGEPDIVKVTEQATYYAQQRLSYPNPTPLPEPTVLPDVERRDTVESQRKSTTPSVKQISNPNTGNVSVTGEIKQAEKLLRSDSALVAYNNSVITGYSLQNSGSNINKNWDMNINTSHIVETTRRIGSTVYFVTREATTSCPVYPINNRGEIQCNNVYHPNSDISGSTSMYTVFGVDMKTGDITDEITFVGTSDTTVYMSQEKMYVSYESINFGTNDIIDIALSTDGIPEDSDVAESLRDLKQNEISDEAKRVELENIIEQGGNQDAVDLQTFRRNFSQNIREHVKDNRRDIYTSKIVSMDVSDGEITPSEIGEVPGVPLDQFAFDESDGELRVATTVNPSNRQSSQNDVYVLDDELDVTGSVQGMAEGQRIYAVRFIGDTGYVITYRQVDPLHVIDLTNPENPKEVGVLKLPGFSQYLHNVGDGKLLGIGESANSKGKVVLFDVSDPENPEVADSFVMNERSTAVSESHRAFIDDPEKDNAYIPAGNSLYIVDYDNNELQQKSKVKLDAIAKRTRIYNDKLITFSDSEIAVVDRSGYNITNTLDLN